jgi:hypothetical protein
MIANLEKKKACIGCGEVSKVFDKKWYCGIDFITAHGACKKKKRINNIPENR